MVGVGSGWDGEGFKGPWAPSPESENGLFITRASWHPSILPPLESRWPDGTNKEVVKRIFVLPPVSADPESRLLVPSDVAAGSYNIPAPFCPTIAITTKFFNLVVVVICSNG